MTTPLLRTLGAAALLSLPTLAAAQARPAGDAETARLMQRLSVLAADSMEGRRAGSAGAARARTWLIGQLTAMGAKPVSGSSFEVPFAIRPRQGSTDTVGVNIVARIPGKNPSGPALVISAHYDHLGVRNGETYNGADDDASGCIALLTIGERLLKEPPQHDVILAFFDAEEMGLQGSRALVASPPFDLARVAMDISLDMIARQDGKALWVAGTSHNPTLKPHAEAAAKSASVPIRFGHDTKDLKPGDDWTNSSDHGPFHAKGIPFLYLGVEDHPDYHKPGDDVEKVDAAFYRGTVEFAYALARRVDAALPEILKTRR
ncbi:MAG: M28 family peptidase [Gemmatimonadetes bacterium]|nr:M28 family peptidase [Gemmatimonadota bacterium]